jgi:hypothetical protein
LGDGKKRADTGGVVARSNALQLGIIVCAENNFFRRLTTIQLADNVRRLNDLIGSSMDDVRANSRCFMSNHESRRAVGTHGNAWDIQGSVRKVGSRRRWVKIGSKMTKIVAMIATDINESDSSKVGKVPGRDIRGNGLKRNNPACDLALIQLIEIFDRLDPAENYHLPFCLGGRREL